MADEGTELEARIDALESAFRTDAAAHRESLTRLALEQAARRLNVIDPEAAALLADRGRLELDDAGRPTNAGEVVRALLTERPYLATPAPVQPTPAPERPIVSPAGTYDAKLEEQGAVDALRQHGFRWWREHSREIEAAYRQHRVDSAKPAPITADPKAPTYQRSQLKDYGFVKKNMSDLIAAEREGRIYE